MAVNLKTIFADPGTNNSAAPSAITPEATKAEPARLNLDQLDKDIKAMTGPKYKQSLVDLSIDIPEPVPVLKIGDKVIFTRGSISTIGGMQKSRKTYLVDLFASDFLKFTQEDKVLIVDTEMAKAYTYKSARRIHRMMGWNTHQNHERLIVISLDEDTPDERIAKLKEAVEDIHPRIVFLDGIADLVSSVNDDIKAAEIVQTLRNLCGRFDCHICCILHFNRGNGQLRGHVGSEVLRKSETIITITKNDDTSTVQSSDMRQLPFDPFTFRINDDLPERCATPVKSAKTDKLRNLFENILPGNITLSHGDLHSRVMAAENVKSTAAQNRINDAIDAGIIVKVDDGYYFPKPINDESNLPF